MTKKNSGLITKVKISKGFESISREMAQNYELSFQAVGLLTYLETLKDDAEIYKTSLYSQRKQNKRTMVENMWDELVQHGYMIQFKENTKSTYSYRYFFSSNGLTKETCLQIIESMEEINFRLYFSKKQLQILGIENVEVYLRYLKGEIELPNNDENSKNNKDKAVDSKVKESQSQTTVEKQQWRYNNVSTSVEKQQWSDPLLFHHSGETATIKLSTLDLEEEEEDLININKAPEILKNDKLKEIHDIFLECGFSEEDSMAILYEIQKDKRLMNDKLILEQLYFVIQKSQEEPIYDLPKYYLNGLRKKLSTANLSLSDKLRETKIRNAGVLYDNSGDVDGDIPLFNWLDDEDPRYN